MASVESNRVVIEGLDGCGKTTAALKAAELLSSRYRDSSIKVVDSSGVYFYSNGELADLTWRSIGNSIPKAKNSKLRSITQLGAFTAARRMAEGWISGAADLVVSVRDPFRVDPAVYAVAYGLPRLKNMDTAARLQFFNRLTTAPHPSNIVVLETDTEQAHAKVHERAGDPSDSTVPPELDYHETEERQSLIADELPRAIDQYVLLYGGSVSRVPAYQEGTFDAVAAQFEPVIYGAMNAKDARNLRVNYL